MSDHEGIIDIDTLLCDLRLAVRYAARVGLLKDRDIIKTLEQAEATIAAHGNPDVLVMTSALNEIALLIAPMTIADLHFKRDPFLWENQRRSGIMQMALMIFALVVMAIIGDYMHSLQAEQDALAALDKLRDLRPQEKLSELRRFAQWDQPLALPRTPRSLNDQYHQKVYELVVINSTVSNTYSRARAANDQPMIPFRTFLFPPELPPSILGPPAPAAALTPLAANDQARSTPCAEDAHGELRLPEETKNYPEWMKTALRDSLGDMCFQLTVVTPNGGGQILSEALPQMGVAGSIKAKINLRSVWFLPFMFGLLGSVLFVMRNIASVRTPSMGWLEVAMRISLGGVAGIVVGWFTSTDAALLPSSSLISLPFALAVLTGYGIDILFNALDRLHQAVSVSTAHNR